MDASQVTVENIAAVVGVGLTAGWLAIRNYLAERKPTIAQESADLALLAGSITDMRPVKRIEEHIKRLADAAERTAGANERIAERLETQAEDDEVERRAKVRAAEILASENKGRR